MPATFSWGEANGTATGSPATGTTITTLGSIATSGHSSAVSDVNWKNEDTADAGSSDYASYPITAGNNSYTKYQFGYFSGTFDTISNGLWAHTSGTFGTGITLAGIVTSTYATPATTTNASLTQNMTSTISIGSGQTVEFSTNYPQDPSPTSTLSATGYTQFLATQLQTTTSASPGDTTSATLTLQYNED